MIESATQLLPFLTLAVLGAGHCAAMCGGFAIGLSGHENAPRGLPLRRQLSYVLGKALTYSILGLGVASLGMGLVKGGEGALGNTSLTLPRLQLGLTWFAGGMMVWLGVRSMRGGGTKAPGPLARKFQTPLRELRKIFQGALQLPGASRGLATGLVTGLLPCGLSWGALALCIAQPPLQAMLGMFVFGLGTAPVLIFIGLGWNGFSARFGPLAARAAGPVLIVFGLLTLLRGAPEALRPMAATVLPECCAESDTHGPEEQVHPQGSADVTDPKRP